MTSKTTEEANETALPVESQTAPRAVFAAIRAELQRARRDSVVAFSWVLALVAVAALLETTLVAFGRMDYPYTLEWMEGGMVDHVRRVAAGEPLYRAPSFAWTPFIYTPLYYYVAAAFGKLFGIGFFTLRLVSTLSMLGSFGLIAAFVRKETAARGVVAPLVATALFAASFRATGSWFDLARIDSLFFVLFLGGAYAARHGRGWVSAIAAGALFCLAFFTKQSALMIVSPLLAAMFFLSWRRALVASSVFAATTLGAIVWLNRATEGWFGYYVFEVPSKHFVDTKLWHDFAVKAVWNPMPLGVLLALFAFAVGAFKSRGPALFYASMLAGAWVHGASGLMHVGGYENALIPACGTLSILAGIALAWILAQPGDAGLTRRLKGFGLVAILVQLTILVYDPREPVPRRRDVHAGDTMIELLEREHGSFYSFGFGYYGARIGHREIFAHSMALADIFRTSDPVHTGPLLEDILASVRSRRFDTIVVDGGLDLLPPEVRKAVNESYRFSRPLYDSDAGWPKTAYGARPGEIYKVK